MVGTGSDGKFGTVETGAAVDAIVAAVVIVIEWGVM